MVCHLSKIFFSFCQNFPKFHCSGDLMKSTYKKRLVSKTPSNHKITSESTPLNDFSIDIDCNNDPALTIIQNEFNNQDESDDEEDIVVPSYWVGTLVFSFVMLGTYLFTQIEPWDTFESFYFCFVTITTIGYADVMFLNF